MLETRSLPAIAWTLSLLLGLSAAALAETTDVAALAKTINAVGPQGAGHREAIAAWEKLTQVEAPRLPEVLAGMDQANRLSVNWLRAAADTIAQRHLDRRGVLPVAALEAFLADTTHAPLARQTAYELIIRGDPSAKPRLLAAALNDPSLELRRDAVAQALGDARRLLDAGRKPEAAAAYRTTLTAARDLDQVQEATRQLRALGEQVNLPKHFGFLMQWQLIGPFDNTNQSAFDVVYGPELNADPQATHPGKSGPVAWLNHATSDEFGIVDLTQALAKHKGAIAYARAEFLADRERPAELRLGCINANKVWLNGELLTSNHVYHSGTQMDQYVGRGRLKAGRNVILLKICQNEQTESWAQRWQFQLRVCDQTGTAILATDRP